jgi:Tfp pilus assembly major pilin PilA
LENNQDKIVWTQLSANPSARAIALLEKNQDKINWTHLSENPSALTLLEKNQDNIDWDILSSNPSALTLLENNQDKIDWFSLSGNPAIFEYDYKGMKDAMYNGIKEDLVKNRFHPKNIPKFRDWGMDGFEDYEDE